MDDTVKPALRRKRDKRVTENHEFDSFTRRIVRAYARRVADGDIEALTALNRLSSTVDAAIADAVRGLRTFVYSLGRHRHPTRRHPPGRPDALGRPQRCVSRFLRQEFQGFIESTVLLSSVWGLLIQAAVGRAAGCGDLLTNRSGLRAYAASRTSARAARTVSARP